MADRIGIRGGQVVDFYCLPDSFLWPKFLEDEPMSVSGQHHELHHLLFRLGWVPISEHEYTYENRIKVSLSPSVIFFTYVSANHTNKQLKTFDKSCSIDDVIKFIKEQSRPV
jgi:hypothetical protein